MCGKIRLCLVPSRSYVDRVEFNQVQVAGLIACGWYILISPKTKIRKGEKTYFCTCGIRQSFGSI